MEKTFTKQFDPEAYEAIRRDGAPWILREARGLIAVSGGEAVQFLNGLITNDVAKLEDGTSMLAAFPNAKGRLIAFARVDREGGRFIFETEEATHETLLANLERFTFAGDFKVEDLSESLAILSIRGEKSVEVLGPVFDDGCKPGAGIVEAAFEGAIVRVLPSVRGTGFDLRIESAQAGRLADSLAAAGAILVEGALAELLRIESGVPKFGVDVDEDTVVPEIGLDGLISYQKGCYIGQEVIARIHFRGKVAKELKGIVFDSPEAIVNAGDELLSPEGKNAGVITSKAYSPALKKHIAMAMVRNAHLESGTQLRLDSQNCRVSDLPFIS